MSAVQHESFVVVHLLSCVRPFETPWTAAHQASLSLTVSQRLPKLVSIKSVMPSNHLILCRPFLLLPSIFPSFRVFSRASLVVQMVKNLLANAGDMGSIHRLGRSPGEGNGSPLQYSCQRNSMNGRAWRTTVTKSQT